MAVSTWIAWGVVAYLVAMLILRSRKPGLPVWSIMSFAMFIVVAGGLVSIDEMNSLVNLDVVLFLVGMFSIVSVMEYSGVIDYLAAWFISRFRTRYRVLYAIALVYGLLSAYTVNDALTLMGTPIVLTVSKALSVDLRMLLLLVAFSITIGSAMSPVGNPQNMLIASSSGIQAPFIAFTKKLAVPTVLNLVITTAVLIRLYKVKNQRLRVLVLPSEKIRDRREAVLGTATFAATLLLFVLNDALETLGLPHVQRRGLIPFVTASVCYILSRDPRRVLRGVSWGTIVFFISMFITMNGIWRSGGLTPILNFLLPQKTGGLGSLLRISATALIMSQVLSNVPFTGLFVEYMKSLGFGGEDVNSWVTLAMASTIAGNLTVLGAASNIILLEVVEQRGRRSLTFFEFLRAGLVVTLINLLVYLPFIVLVP